MRAFACGTCRSLVFCENFHCVTCGSALGFERARADVVVLDGTSVRCVNHQLAECNWLVHSEGALCGCCELTRTRPAHDDLAGLAAFAATEAANRRQVYQLLEKLRLVHVVVGAQRVETRP